MTVAHIEELYSVELQFYDKSYQCISMICFFIFNFKKSKIFDDNETTAKKLKNIRNILKSCAVQEGSAICVFTSCEETLQLQQIRSFEELKQEWIISFKYIYYIFYTHRYIYPS